VLLAIVVVNQSIMGRPPLLDNQLSTRASHFRPTLRQSRTPDVEVQRKPLTAIGFEEDRGWAEARQRSVRLLTGRHYGVPQLQSPHLPAVHVYDRPLTVACQR
jgi:hypothetical protein